MKLILMYFAFVFIAAFVFTNAIKFRCDYTSTGDGWYKFHVMPLTFEDARVKCSREGGQLASPTTLRIKNILKDIASAHGVKVFTGIHAVSKGNFYSIDGTPLGEMLHAWSDGEPNNYNNSENCISLDWNGLFADCHCNATLPFVCYRKKTAATIDANACGTPDPGYELDSGTKKCYKFHTETVSFDTAEFICSAEGGRLAIINSDQEAQVLINLFAKYPDKLLKFQYVIDIRLGFFYNQKDGVWITLEGETIKTAGYEKWNTGEPNNYYGDEYCGGMTRGGFFDDVNCYGKLAFICEKGPDYPPVCEERYLA